MSSVFAPSLARQRRVFGPFDPNAQDVGADPSVFSPAPDLGPAGGPPPQDPMFTPPPNGVFQPAPQDKLDQANSILQGGGRPSAFAPPPDGVHADVSNASGHAVRNAFLPADKSAATAYDPGNTGDAVPTGQGSVFGPPATGQRPRNAAGDEMMARPPEPPPFIPAAPPRNVFAPKGTHDDAQHAIDAENAHNAAMYQAQMRAYESEVYRQGQNQWYRNQFGTQNPGRDAAMRDAAEIRSNAPSKGNRTAQDVYLDPTSTPQQKSDALKWQSSQPGMFQSDRAQPRPTSMPATIDLVDGTTTQGSYDPATGRYRDGDGNVIPAANLKGARKLGTPPTNPKAPKKSLADFLGTPPSNNGGAVGGPALPHPPAATRTGLKPNNRYRINGKVVETDAQGNIVQ